MDADRAPAPPRPLGHRVVRWFLVACALVAVAELSYLVVANGCARTMLRAMAGRAGLELELGTVRTLYPGHLVVQDLAVRDARARWAIHAQAGRFSLELGALLRGSLHLRAASVTGARIVVEPSLFSSVPATASVPPARSATALSAAPRASVRLDHLEGTLRSVRTGAFELLGPVRVTLEDGRFDGSGASVRGCIELADAALHHAAATAALVRGQVDFELGSASTTRLRRLSGTARLSGRIIGVPRALSPVAPEALIDGAAFEASLAFERGEAPDGSALRLELGRAVLQHADGGTTRCGRGSTLLLAFRKHERAVRVELRAPVLEITDREGSPLARLEPLVASLDLSLVASSGSVGTEAAFGEHERRRGARLCGRARVHSERVELLALGTRSRSSLVAGFDFERTELVRGAMLVGSGTVHLANVALSSEDGFLPSSLAITLDIEKARLRASQPSIATGTLSATGGDAGIVLDLARVEPRARRALGDLEGRPFRATASFESGPVATLVRDGAFESGAARARGTVLFADDHVRGVVLVRKGGLTLALTLERAGARAFFSPPRGWLERTCREVVMAASRARWDYR